MSEHDIPSSTRKAAEIGGEKLYRINVISGYIVIYLFSLGLLYEFQLILTIILEKKEYLLWLEKIKPIFDHAYSWMVHSTPL